MKNQHQEESTAESWGLRRRIFLLMMAFVAVNVLAIASFYSYTFKETLEKEFSERAELIAGHLADAVVEGVALEDEKLLKTWGENAAHADQVIFVAVYDAKGFPIFTNSSADVAVGTRQQSEPSCTKALTTGGHTVLETLAPVTDERHGQIGTIRLLFSLEHLEEQTARTLLSVIILSMAGMLLVSLLGAYLIGLHIEKPIRRLVTFVESLSSDGYGKRISPTGSREVQAMAKSFNSMSMRIRQDVDAIAQGEQNLRTILDSIGDAVIGTDDAGKITWMNPAAETLIGCTQEEAANRFPRELYQLRDPASEKSSAGLHEIPQTGEPHPERELVLIGTMGKEHRVSASGSPRRNQRGELTAGAVLVFRDVSEEEHLRTQLNQSRKMDALGQLAGGVAHDLNNMLGGIIGGTELLQKEELSQRGKQLTKIVIESGERAAALTRNLLDFSRQGKVVNTPLDVHEAIGRSTALLTRTIDKRIRIHTDLACKPSTSLGDSAQVESALLNLGINASHAMPEGGDLTLSTRRVELDLEECQHSGFNIAPGSFLELSVRDTGTGIPQKDLERIFEPFFTTKALGEGTGLGLAAVYGMVTQHRGAISVESELGVGTVFRLLLPLNDGATISTKHVQSIAPPGKGRILVVDDEPLVLALAVRALEDQGFEVISAQNGKQALEAFREQHESIDVVLLDMLMPEMNGHDCFFALREVDPNAQVILSSGFTGNSDLTEMNAAGLTGVLNKPYRQAELVQLITKLTTSA